MSAYVYRCLDEDGLLIYVGTTKNMTNRFALHERDTPWWCEVAQIIVEPYKDEATARLVEATAIYQEAPLYNRDGVVTEAQEVTVVTVCYQPGYQVTRLPTDSPLRRRQKANAARRRWLGLRGLDWTLAFKERSVVTGNLVTKAGREVTKGIPEENALV